MGEKRYTATEWDDSTDPKPLPPRDPFIDPFIRRGVMTAAASIAALHAFTVPALPAKPKRNPKASKQKAQKAARKAARRKP